MSVRTRLLLASALMLFLELALIRWTASNVVHLGYFSNFVLLGSFLGVGVGFLRAGRTDRDPLYFPIALAVLVVGILLFPVTVDRAGSDLIFFSDDLNLSGPPPWLVLPLIFLGSPVRASWSGGASPHSPRSTPTGSTWSAACPGSSRSRACRCCTHRRWPGASSSRAAFSRCSARGGAR